MTESPNKMSSSSRRRINKPLMERRRRARINDSLIQLKSLVLNGMKKDPSRYNRLEKADILEMTVNHLKSLHRHQLRDSLSKNPGVLGKYQAGFRECSTEVTNYLQKTNDLDPEVKTKIFSHLQQCQQRLGDNACLTTAMSADDHTGDNIYPDSDCYLSDEENTLPLPTYCSDVKTETSPQSMTMSTTQCVKQAYTPGLLQLGSGVQVVLIPKDLLPASSSDNTTVQCRLSAQLEEEGRGHNTSDSSLNRSSDSSLNRSSDFEPDSTVTNDSVAKVADKDSPVSAPSKQIPHPVPAAGASDNQDGALDLSLASRKDQLPCSSMWRPW